MNQMRAKPKSDDRVVPDFRLSSRIAAVSPSATIAITSMTRELRSQGVDVIGRIALRAGQPLFIVERVEIVARVDRA